MTEHAQDGIFPGRRRGGPNMWYRGCELSSIHNIIHRTEVPGARLLYSGAVSPHNGQEGSGKRWGALAAPRTSIRSWLVNRLTAVQVCNDVEYGRRRSWLLTLLNRCPGVASAVVRANVLASDGRAVSAAPRPLGPPGSFGHQITSFCSSPLPNMSAIPSAW